MLNYHHLKYFLVIAREGSVTAAAKKLHVAQASVSIQLKKLEDTLGQQLFLRNGRNLVLSETGRVALDYAELIFRTGDELLDVIKHQLSKKKQFVRVGAVSTLSRNFQAQLLRPLLHEEGLGMFVHSGNMKELLTMLSGHLLDVVLSNLPASGSAETPFNSHLINKQQVSLVGKPEVFEPGKFSFPADLNRVSLFLPGHDSNYRAEFEFFMEKNRIKPNIVAEVDDMAMLRLLAMEGVGMALVPRVDVNQELVSKVIFEYHRFRDIKESFFAITSSRTHSNEYIKQALSPFIPV